MVNELRGAKGRIICKGLGKKPRHRHSQAEVSCLRCHGNHGKCYYMWLEDKVQRVEPFWGFVMWRGNYKRCAWNNSQGTMLAPLSWSFGPIEQNVTGWVASQHIVLGVRKSKIK